MSLQLNDRVRETSITTGTVPIVLGGAAVGFQTISSSISTANTFPYVVELTGGSEWEIGIGSYISGNNSIIRTQILNSSNNGSIVNFSSGAKNVFISIPASLAPVTVKGLSQFSSTSSAELASIISDETGSGKLVFSNNAVFVSPNIGSATGNTLTLSGDLSVSGNVYLSGNVTTLSSNNLSINDPLIYLAQDNPANLQDIGIVGHFTSSIYQHTGLVRDATDGVWKLFSNVAAEPTTTMDFTGAVYDTLQVGSITSSNAVFTVANGSAPFLVSSNTLVSNLNADLLDGQHGTYYTGLSGSAFDQANSASSLAQTKVSSFYQNFSPTTSNTKDTWIHSDTGVKYQNVGNTSNPVWIEYGPTGVANNLMPGMVSATSITSSNGIYSTGTYTGSYSDGIVLDYIDGTGRISVGSNDGLKFYNGGTGINTLLTITPAGQIYSTYNGANGGSLLVLTGNNTIGGTNYFDFLKITNGAAGATNPIKSMRLNSTGGLEIIDSSYTNNIFTLTDSGNITNKGTIIPGAYSAGQVIKDIMLSNNEVTVVSTTIAGTNSNVNFVTYNYTPVSSSSYLLVHYHLSKYAPAGTTVDSWYSALLVDGNEIAYGWQMVNNTNNGTSGRSGVLFPLTGRYTNSSTSVKQIQVAARRDSADDSILIDNSSTSMWLRITEVAR